MDLRIVILLCSAGIVLYAYLIYPLLLLAMRRRGVPTPGASAVPWELPDISITLPAYNAEATLRPVLDALVASEYPRTRRQILVVSDGSSDGTDAIVGEYAADGVELLRIEGRRGKTEIENHAFAYLRGSVIVNTDSSVLVHPLAIRRLVEAFADSEVGVASARDVSVASAAAPHESSEAAFVGYEMWVRALETEAGGIVGASGCLYAVRAHLHRRVLAGHLSRDFSAALWARFNGYRSVSVQEALCYVPRAVGMRVEFRRKIRTMSRGLQTLFFHSALLNPLHYGSFAWKLWSHKLIRWFVPYALVLGAVMIASLGFAAPVALGLALAALGWWWPPKRRVPQLAARAGYLVSGTIAGLIAWKRALLRDGAAVWEPTPRAVATSEASPPGAATRALSTIAES